MAALQQKLEQAEEEKNQFETQVEALLEYNKQAKNIEVQEKSLKKLKGTLDQKQKALEAEEKRQKQSEDLLKKEQTEWKAVNTKRQQVLEADLQSKLSYYADKEAEYVQKWKSLEDDKKELAESQAKETANLEQLQKQAQDEYLAVQKTKAEVQQKERRLDEERKSIRLQADSAALKHMRDMEKVQSQGNTKLLMAATVCFLFGMAVAIFVFNGSATTV